MTAAGVALAMRTAVSSGIPASRTAARTQSISVTTLPGERFAGRRVALGPDLGVEPAHPVAARRQTRRRRRVRHQRHRLGAAQLDQRARELGVQVVAVEDHAAPQPALDEERAHHVGLAAPEARARVERPARPVARVADVRDEREAARDRLAKLCERRERVAGGDDGAGRGELRDRVLPAAPLRRERDQAQRTGPRPRSCARHDPVSGRRGAPTRARRACPRRETGPRGGCRRPARRGETSARSRASARSRCSIGAVTSVASRLVVPRRRWKSVARARARRGRPRRRPRRHRRSPAGRRAPARASHFRVARRRDAASTPASIAAIRPPVAAHAHARALALGQKRGLRPERQAHADFASASMASVATADARVHVLVDVELRRPGPRRAIRHHADAARLQSEQPREREQDAALHLAVLHARRAHLHDPLRELRRAIALEAHRADLAVRVEHARCARRTRRATRSRPRAWRTPRARAAPTSAATTE